MADQSPSAIMEYISFAAPGGPEVLHCQSGLQPKIQDDEVLIKVHAAGVNRPDILQRQGTKLSPDNSSPVLGMEVAGTIAEVGPRAQPWRVGQRVCALTNGGGYAEFAAAPAAQCMPVPANLSMLHAAAVPAALFTVWANVYSMGKLGVGDTLLVHGGAGGIGSIAIQMARVTGARVYATAGTDEKCAICSELGALRAINYNTEDYVEVMRQTTGRGADVILDTVGGAYIQRNIEVAAVGARIVNIGYQNSAVATVDFGPVMLKQLSLTASHLGLQTPAQKAEVAYQLRRKLWPAVCAERIKPIIHTTLPLAQAAKAHKLLEQNSIIGKVLLSTAL